MQLLLVLLLSSFISGCATTSADSFEEVEPKEVPTQVFAIAPTVQSEVTATGNTIYLDTSFNKQPVLDAFTVPYIKKEFQDRGYVFVNKISKAAIFISIRSSVGPARLVFGFKEVDLTKLKKAPGSTGKTEVEDTTAFTHYRNVNGETRVFKYLGPSYQIFDGLQVEIKTLERGKPQKTILDQTLWAQQFGTIFFSKDLEELISLASKSVVPVLQKQL